MAQTGAYINEISGGRFWLGIGVSRVAFQSPPSKWTDVAPVSEVPEGEHLVVVDALPAGRMELHGRVGVLDDRLGGDPADEDSWWENGKHGKAWRWYDTGETPAPRVI